MTEQLLITRLAEVQETLAAAQARIAELEACLPADHSLLSSKQRRQTQEMLWISEERFRLLVERVEDYAIYMLDPDGKVMSWNIGAERLEGYRSDEIVGQHFSLFFTPEAIQAGKPQHLLAIALAQGSVEDEDWRVHKEGERFWSNSVLTVLRKEDGTLVGFAKIARDLTRRKQAELERERLLAESATAQQEAVAAHTFLTNIIERIRDGFVALDNTWHYTYVNQQAAQMLNREKPEDLIGKHIWTEYPEGIGQSFYHAYYKALETQQPVYLDFRQPGN